MQKYIFSSLTSESLKALVYLSENTSAERWEPNVKSLTDEEAAESIRLKKRLQNSEILPLNEATVWGKAIFPLLISAEKIPLSAWANVSLSAQFLRFVLEGYVDGTISVNRAGQSPCRTAFGCR